MDTNPQSGQAPGRIVIAGLGPVAHRFITALLDRAPQTGITAITDEHSPAYDRVHLTSYTDNWDRDALMYDPYPGHVEIRNARVTAINREERTVDCDDGGTVAYDHLVIATGSRAFVPPVPGADLDGCFAYRTLDDLDGIRATVDAAKSRSGHPVGAVIGGGLVGLEAAGALRGMGVECHVIQIAPRLMPQQTDEAAGAVLAGLVSGLGVHLHLDTSTTGITASTTRPGGLDLELADRRTPLPVDLVVFATGIRPNDQLAEPAGLPTGERGGILVDDFCATVDPDISAIGEVAAVHGRTHGLIGPGNATADVLARRLTGEATEGLTEPDLSTELKLLGVDMASFGEIEATGDRKELLITDPVGGTYRKLLLDADGRTLRGGILVGDSSGYSLLHALLGTELPADPLSFLVPSSSAGPDVGVAALPANAQICSCNAVTKGRLVEAIADGAHSVEALKGCTRAGTSCGSCLPLMRNVLEAEGIEQSRAVCGHFPQTRAELFQIAQSTGVSSFPEFIARFGTGRGCEVCKPTLASIFASLDTGEHVLGDGRVALQDTNDRFLANIQRNGSYSVVPRMPAGQVTPEQLIEIGAIAREYDLFTKVTGAQRLVMFGARMEDLPAIWSRLIDAGMESGQAYGKSLRAVKSCVGTDWCRFGQQDSVAMANLLELRYRGLRSPHKLKMGVSGCARECAEARSKDVGVIATEKGWNLYVGGNGGATPRHSELLASEIDDETLIRCIDRFIGFYVRTADRLQRTAHWIEETEGGLDHIRAVVVDDSLGIAADLEAYIERHVSSYSDEWKSVLDDPEKLSRFTPFVNAPEEKDRTIQFDRHRDGNRLVPLPMPTLQGVN
ncbi:nitrite reductase large subunit NirB [Corynebacterium halotolerans]|uniref:assimilatory sulfite reductase (ferredoxin) n=1 Tax=Corynebacterium halotolerans YIM 70093 = DSM 44683 TaxID=1121362 RepID=M1NWP9_9CORY|nr:nitrite reductase large subunit NirB [Corynebacterium halotolerans]AGF71915.1 nitrite reductase large subunit [Corynebacterium halotolerans YIM 70093 = DSM 44683]